MISLLFLFGGNMDRYIIIEEIVELCKVHKKARLQIHHTWLPNHASFDGTNGLQLVQNMRIHHKNVNGWDDIGQHLTLLPDGRFVTGRAFNLTPCGIGKYNLNSDLMIEMVGNFDKGNDRFEGKQKEVILKLSRHFLDYFGEKGIVFHREFSTKSCPGTGIDKKEFLKEVATMQEEKIYNKVDAVPEWAKNDIKELIDNNILRGDENGNLGLSDTLIRSIIINKRYTNYILNK